MMQIEQKLGRSLQRRMLGREQASDQLKLDIGNELGCHRNPTHWAWRRLRDASQEAKHETCTRGLANEPDYSRPT
jgi:hypothetical protein